MEERQFDNRSRFNGISELYHAVRPHFPQEALRLLKYYTGKSVQCTIDLGCGTGLSTRALLELSETVIGIDPNADMLARATAFLGDAKGVFLCQGTAENISAGDASADLIVCSQAFHWMRPDMAIPEICRVLRPDGVFAAVDYDWPGVFDWRCERAYEELIRASERVLQCHPELSDATHKWDKRRHVENLKTFGVFRYVREIVFCTEETCTAERFCLMALSQSGVQLVLRSEWAQELDNAVQALRHEAQQAAGRGVQTITIPYRMRLAIR